MAGTRVQNFCTELEEGETRGLPSFSLVEDACNNSNHCHDNQQGDDDTSCRPTSTCSCGTFTGATVTMARGGGVTWRLTVHVREIQLLDIVSTKVRIIQSLITVLVNVSVQSCDLQLAASLCV